MSIVYPDLPASLAEDVGHFLAMLRYERQLAKESLVAYEGDLKCFAGWADAGGLADHRTPAAPDLRCYLEYLAKKGLSPATISRRLAALRGFYTYLLQEERIERAAFKAVLSLANPKQLEHLPRVLSRDEAVKLLNAPKPNEKYCLRDKAILEFLYSTGARLSEALDLELSGLQLDSGSARVHGKGSKTRQVPLGAYAVRFLREYLLFLRPRLAKVGCPYVFVSSRGGRLGRCHVWGLVKKYALRAGLAAFVSPHTLRHTCATHLLSGGADIRPIQEQLGHSDPQTTTIYVHLDTRSLHAVHSACHPNGAETTAAAAPAQEEALALTSHPPIAREKGDSK